MTMGKSQLCELTEEVLTLGDGSMSPVGTTSMHSVLALHFSLLARTADTLLLCALVKIRKESVPAISTHRLRTHLQV